MNQFSLGLGLHETRKFIEETKKGMNPFLIKAGVNFYLNQFLIKAMDCILLYKKICDYA